MFTNVNKGGGKIKIHHISLLTADFEQNFHFYVDILGLRLVKNSINQGNIYMRHVYYGDFLGSPGSVVTFFPDERFNHERKEGRNFISGIKFSIPQGRMEFWIQRLKKFGIKVKIEQEKIEFRDFDEIPITLIEQTKILYDWTVNTMSDIPANAQITGIIGTKLGVPQLEATQTFFQDMVGGEEGIEIYETSLESKKLIWGKGSVDHIAFAVESSQDLDKIWLKAEKLGYTREAYVDRGYFNSVYLIEPGGNRIEFATLTPGFTLDESIQELGTTFALPPRYEAKRDELFRYYAKKKVHFDKVSKAVFNTEMMIKKGDIHRDHLHL